MALITDESASWAGRVELKPGQVLVIECPRPLSPEQVDRLMVDALAALSGDRVLVLTDGATARFIGD